jgi:hypothetical protein
MVLHCAVSVSALNEVYSIQPCDNVASDNVASDFRQIVWISTLMYFFIMFGSLPNDEGYS